MSKTELKCTICNFLR